MIRDSIEAGTPVFHNVHGFGYFQKFTTTQRKCIVTFDPRYPIVVLSRDLTEVEDK